LACFCSQSPLPSLKLENGSWPNPCKNQL
jgi:hypothetical protein